MEETSESSRVDKQLQAIQELEEAIELPVGFFERLYLEDDWSFVVKLHALIEAAVTHVLVEHIGDPRLLEPFSHLPLSDKASGKMAFAKSLNLVNKPYRRFVAKFSELRNNLVHNVSQARFTFSELVASLMPGEQRDLASAFAVGLDVTEEERVRFFIDSPKGVIWISALGLLSILSLGKKLAAVERELALSDKVLEALGKINSSSSA